MNDVTGILEAIESGAPDASEELLPLIYEDLRKLAAARLSGEKAGQTLQATALVHGAYVRLVKPDKPQNWNSRGHFFGAAAEAMRRILVERARQKATAKAGGHLRRVELPVEVTVSADDQELNLVQLDKALKRLELEDPRRAQIVKLRFFAGLTSGQAAEAVGVARSTADSDWAYAKAWLRVEME